MTDRINMRQTWNQISPHYQAEHKIPTDFVHYGPHCPNEDDLQLIGDVRGKRVLEVGCGGGQCSIAFAKRGAIATGLDISDEQVKFARLLAAENAVEATFHRSNAEDLTLISDESQDIVFSAYALMYVRRLDRCFAEVARVLGPGGLFVFSLDHPFWYCLAEKELLVKFSYFDGEYSYAGAEGHEVASPGPPVPANGGGVLSSAPGRRSGGARHRGAGAGGGGERAGLGGVLCA